MGNEVSLNNPVGGLGDKLEPKKVFGVLGHATVKQLFSEDVQKALGTDREKNLFEHVEKLIEQGRKLKDNPTLALTDGQQTILKAYQELSGKYDSVFKATKEMTFVDEIVSSIGKRLALRRVGKFLNEIGKWGKGIDGVLMEREKTLDRTDLVHLVARAKLCEEMATQIKTALDRGLFSEEEIPKRLKDLAYLEDERETSLINAGKGKESFVNQSPEETSFLRQKSLKKRLRWISDAGAKGKGMVRRTVKWVHSFMEEKPTLPASTEGQMSKIEEGEGAPGHFSFLGQIWRRTQAWREERAARREQMTQQEQLKEALGISKDESVEISVLKERVESMLGDSQEKTFQEKEFYLINLQGLVRSVGGEYLGKETEESLLEVLGEKIKEIRLNKLKIQLKELKKESTTFSELHMKGFLRGKSYQEKEFCLTNLLKLVESVGSECLEKETIGSLEGLINNTIKQVRDDRLKEILQIKDGNVSLPQLRKNMLEAILKRHSGENEAYFHEIQGLFQNVGGTLLGKENADNLATMLQSLILLEKEHLSFTSKGVDANWAEHVKEINKILEKFSLEEKEKIKVPLLFLEACTVIPEGNRVKKEVYLQRVKKQIGRIDEIFLGNEEKGRLQTKILTLIYLSDKMVSLTKEKTEENWFDQIIEMKNRLEKFSGAERALVVQKLPLNQIIISILEKKEISTRLKTNSAMKKTTQLTTDKDLEKEAISTWASSCGSEAIANTFGRIGGKKIKIFFEGGVESSFKPIGGAAADDMLKSAYTLSKNLVDEYIKKNPSAEREAVQKMVDTLLVRETIESSTIFLLSVTGSLGGLSVKAEDDLTYEFTIGVGKITCQRKGTCSVKDSNKGEELFSKFLVLTTDVKLGEETETWVEKMEVSPPKKRE